MHIDIEMLKASILDVWSEDMDMNITLVLALLDERTKKIEIGMGVQKIWIFSRGGSAGRGNISFFQVYDGSSHKRNVSNSHKNR